MISVSGDNGAQNRDDDVRWMRRALELAERGWGRVAPNPLVGAVCVRNGEVVGEGWHAEYGAAHAEVEALRQAGEAARGATLYVTLEPCGHHGKTPPCVDAVRDAGVARVVVGARDPNPVAGGGLEQLHAAGIEVAHGVLEEAATDLNSSFFHAFRPEGEKRPWIAIKLALSLDGRMADAKGRSFWITGDEARALVHRERAAMSAIAVGIGTVLADDPQLTVRGVVEPRGAPLRLVFDRRLRIPLESRLVRTAGELPVRVVCDPDASRQTEGELRERGVEVTRADGLPDAFQILRNDDIESVYVEGGARFSSALLREGMIDRLDLFFAPILLGAGGTTPFVGLPDATIGNVSRWRLVRSFSVGSDTLIQTAPR